MRRKQGALLPIEEAILAAGLDLRRKGSGEFHGFAIAKRIKEVGDAHQLTAHGTLYKALGRLEAAGLLESRWEEADLALPPRQPPRPAPQNRSSADGRSSTRSASGVHDTTDGPRSIPTFGNTETMPYPRAKDQWRRPSRSSGDGWRGYRRT